MQVFDARATAGALPYDRLLDRMERLFAEGVRAPVRHHHTMARDNEPDATLLLMPAWAGTHGIVKVATVTPGNAARGLPAVTASVLVFDNVTGEHLAMLDGATLTARRTAAAGALAARHLARAESQTLLVVGAGRIGDELADAFAAALPIQRVLVWNRGEERGRALVDKLGRAGWQAEWQADLQAAVAQADVISCATLATAPLVHGAWLQPGQHLDLIGAFRPDMRETDDAALQRAHLFVDTEAALKEAGELAIPLSTGAITTSDVAGTLYDLCGQGRRARQANDITIFKGVGNAVMDLAAAQVALDILGDAR